MTIQAMARSKGNPARGSTPLPSSRHGGIRAGRAGAAGWTAAAFVALVALAAGCSRRIIRGGPFGIPPATSAQRTASKEAAGAKSLAQKTQPKPDESLRDLFRQQARGAFNPLTDDRRVRLLQTRVQLDPQDLAARLELAGLYEGYRLDEEAFEQFSEALNILSQPAGTGSGPVSSPAEKAALGLARSARGAGRSSEAIPVLAAFVKRSPAASVWNELGLLYDETGDRAAAEQAFRQALVREPNLDRAHNNLGYNLLLQNKPEEAEAAFRRALASNPKSATAHNNLGVILARRGELEAARQQFRLAAADPATAHNNLAVVLLELGEYERSREELVKALTARHYFAPALTNFKLVQELLRQRAELITAGGRLPLSAARIPPTLALAARVDPVPAPAASDVGRNGVDPPSDPERHDPDRNAGAESNVPNVSEGRP